MSHTSNHSQTKKKSNTKVSASWINVEETPDVPKMFVEETPNIDIKEQKYILQRFGK